MCLIKFSRSSMRDLPVMKLLRFLIKNARGLMLLQIPLFLLNLSLFLYLPPWMPLLVLGLSLLLLFLLLLLMRLELPELSRKWEETSLPQCKKRKLEVRPPPRP